MNILKDDAYYMNPETGSIDLGSNCMADQRSLGFPIEDLHSLEEMDYSGMGFDDLSYLMPKECKDRCSESGENYSACKMWVEILNLKQSRETCIKIIQEHGFEDYENDSYEELRIKFLWLAAGMNDE